MPDRTRLALRNWRVVGDKLCCLVSWGPLHTAVSSFLRNIPAVTATSSSGSSTTSALAPTNKAAFYKDYISKDPPPQQMSSVKGIPEQDAATCPHEARYLKGGGNGHANWVHCARCLSRWNLAPEAAALVTGRRLQQVTAEEPVLVAPKGKAKAKAAEQKAGSKRAEDPTEADYLRVIENQKEKMQHLQAQLELLTGTTEEIDMAVDACSALEGSYLSMDQTMQQEAQAVVTEFRRLKAVEEDCRARSKHFPTRDTKDEWIRAADSLRTAAAQMNGYYQNVMKQRAQISSLLLRSGH